MERFSRLTISDQARGGLRDHHDGASNAAENSGELDFDGWLAIRRREWNRLHPDKTLNNQSVSPSVFKLSVLPSEYKRMPFPGFSKPVEVGSFSCDSNRNVRKNRSQLRMLKKTSLQVNFDLNEGYPTQVEYEYHYLHEFLEWINANIYDGGKTCFKSALFDADFAFDRGCLRQICHTPYSIDEWEISVIKISGVYFMANCPLEKSELDKTESERKSDETETERKSDDTTSEKKSDKMESERKWNETERERESAECRQHRMTYWGKKFEAFVTTDQDGQSVANQTVNNLESFFSVVCAKLGTDHRLVFSCETDSLDPTDGQYVELKTRRAFTPPDQLVRFHRSETCKWWIQSFLSGHPRIVAGLRDDNGIVTELQTFVVSELPLHPDVGWSKNVCLNFGNAVLNLIKAKVKEEGVVYVLHRSMDRSRREPVTLRRAVDQDRCNFIPDWFLAPHTDKPLAKLSASPSRYMYLPFPGFTKPVEIGCFSCDSNGNILNNDRSQLRMLKETNLLQQVNFDLSEGYPMQAAEFKHLNNVFKWIDANIYGVGETEIGKTCFKLALFDADFVLLHECLLDICLSPFHEVGWTISVIKMNGVYFMTDHDLKKTEREEEPDETERDGEVDETETATEHEYYRQMTYWHKRFKNCVVTDQNGKSVSNNSVNCRERFCSMMRARLGDDHRLVFCCDIDCLDPTDGQYVKLETQLACSSPDDLDIAHFKRYERSIQLFLAGNPRVVLGLHDKEGIVTKIKTFTLKRPNNPDAEPKRPSDPDAVSKQPSNPDTVSKQPSKPDAVSKQLSNPDAVSNRPSDHDDRCRRSVSFNFANVVLNLIKAEVKEEGVAYVLNRSTEEQEGLNFIKAEVKEEGVVYWFHRSTDRNSREQVTLRRAVDQDFYNFVPDWFRTRHN